MGLGELTNFFAYIYAPAILVTPLGVFSIVCTAALSPYFLKERLKVLGRIGCVLVLVGCAIVTLCGPKDREVSTMDELQEQLLNPGFLIYASLVIIVSIVLMLLVPRYGHKYVMLYITICSSFGSLSVMFCKGVGLALKQTIAGINQFTHWATWVCLVSLIICLLIETVYMQRALDLFNSSIFMSVNYVLFTSLVIVASSILYTELRVLGWKNIILTILGFVVNITALYMLHLDKDNNKDDSKIDLKSEDDLKEDIQQSTPLIERVNSKNDVNQPFDPNTKLTPRLTPLSKRCSQQSPISSLGISMPRSVFRDADKRNSYVSLLNESLRDDDLKKNKIYNDDRSSNSIDTKHENSSVTNSEHSLEEPRDSSNINDRCVGKNNQCRSKCVCDVPLITELKSLSKVKNRNNSSNLYSNPNMKEQIIVIPTLSSESETDEKTTEEKNEYNSVKLV